MMKTLRLRTGSSSRTDNSPSGNLSTEHTPRRAPISTATLVASATLALPAKIVKSSFIVCPLKQWIVGSGQWAVLISWLPTIHYPLSTAHCPLRPPAIKMCAPSEEGFGGFHQCLRQRRVGVDAQFEVGSDGPHLDG